MRFGKIEYLNLIIFDVFIKKYPTTNAFKKSLNFKKSYPSALNNEYLFGRINAGFISSVVERKIPSSKALGIIANKEVWSVLVLKRESKLDYQSATSNALSKILNINGEVLIGDRALRYFYKWRDSKSSLDSKDYVLSNPTSLIPLARLAPFHDLATLWYEKTGLPFVFGKLCFSKDSDFYTKIIKAFYAKIGAKNVNKTFIKGIKIPYYILTQYTDKLDISNTFAKEYIAKIYYKISSKEKVALARFYRLLRLKHIKPLKRF